MVDQRMHSLARCHPEILLRHDLKNENPHRAMGVVAVLRQGLPPTLTPGNGGRSGVGKCGQTAAKQALRALPRRRMLQLYMWRMPLMASRTLCSRVHQSLQQSSRQTVAAESESTEQQQQMAEAATSSKKQRKKQRNKARKGHSSAIQPSQVQPTASRTCSSRFFSLNAATAFSIFCNAFLLTSPPSRSAAYEARRVSV